MRAGREPDAAKLVAVTKTVPAEVIWEAEDLGLRDFGESYIQEAQGKVQALKGLAGVRWHMLGHLQRNKARLAVELFDVIQSVDSVRLVEALERHAGDMGKVLGVYLQVNVSGEGQKSGIAPEGLGELVQAVRSAGHLQLEGLMTIPPYDDDPDASRVHFRALKALAERYCINGLSMGMSGDYEVAIEEGATLVRVGTAIFGERGTV